MAAASELLGAGGGRGSRPPPAPGTAGPMVVPQTLSGHVVLNLQFMHDGVTRVSSRPEQLIGGPERGASRACAPCLACTARCSILPPQSR